MSYGKIRIIGGKWRGRKLDVLNLPGLRPTTDRVRETLFNWLQGYIEGAQCLDLFAGTGALGFEALSRGARGVVFVDSEKKIVSHLNRQAELLNADNVEIFQASIPKKIPTPKQFDIIFVDPPFNQNMLISTCFYLEETGYLKEDSLIYLEAERNVAESELPLGWNIIKTKMTGHVAYHLIKKT